MDSAEIGKQLGTMLNSHDVFTPSEKGKATGDIVNYIRDLEQQLSVLLEVHRHAEGLCCGEDWNKGTHAFHHRSRIMSDCKTVSCPEGYYCTTHKCYTKLGVCPWQRIDEIDKQLEEAKRIVVEQNSTMLSYKQQLSTLREAASAVVDDYDGWLSSDCGSIPVLDNLAALVADE